MYRPTLREAAAADAVELAGLHIASWRETYAGLLPAAMLAALSVEARTAMWREILRDPSASGCASVVVAEADRRMVGFGACGRQRDEALALAGYDAEIGAIYILRSHQGHGTGRAIMRALSLTLADLGYAGVSLWVLRENVRARAFYEALGGECLHERVEQDHDATFVEVAYGWRDLLPLIG